MGFETLQAFWQCLIVQNRENSRNVNRLYLGIFLWDITFPFFRYTMIHPIDPYGGNAQTPSRNSARNHIKQWAPSGRMVAKSCTTWDAIKPIYINNGMFTTYSLVRDFVTIHHMYPGMSHIGIDSWLHIQQCVLVSFTFFLGA